MIINHNIPAIITNGSLNKANLAINKASRRLSTGLRINEAKDDAAGLAISNKMYAQIKGIGMAQRNVEDATSLLYTADSGLAEVSEMVHRIREISVQSAHGVYATEDREKLQVEVDQLIEEINSVADKSQFNTQNLLDGKKDFIFQVGQNTGLNLNVKLESVSVMCMGYKGRYGESDYMTYTAVYDDTCKSAKGYSEDVTIRSLASVSSDYSKYYAEGLLDECDNLQAEMESFDAFAQKYEDLIASGASPESSQAIASLNKVKDIYEYIQNTSEYIEKMINEADNGTHASTDGAANISSQIAQSQSAVSDLVSAMKDRLNTLETTGVDSGKALSENAAANLVDTVKNVTIPAAKSYFNSVESGEGVISSQEGSSCVISLCDNILAEVERMRAIIGAAVNRLDYTLNSLQTSDDNMKDALSRVQDTDMAEEMSEYSKYNVIIQAGISMLSQANQRPQQLLSLIQ